MKDNLIVRLNKLMLTHALMALEESAHNLNEGMVNDDKIESDDDYKEALNDYHNAKHLVHMLLDADPFNDLVDTVEYHSISATIEYITVKWRY